MIDLYTTSECPKCVKLAFFLSENNIKFKKKVIDENAEDETDALMLGITSAPTMVYNGMILREKVMFKEGRVDAGAIMNFLKVANAVTREDKK